MPRAADGGGADVAPVTALQALSVLIQHSLGRGADRDALAELLGRLGDDLGFSASHLGRLASHGELEVLAQHGHTQRIASGRIVRFPLLRRLCDDVLRSGEPAWVEDGRDEPEGADDDGLERSVLCLPMRLDDRTWGVLGVCSERPGAFDEEVVALLQPVADTLAWILETDRARRAAEEQVDRERRLRHGLEATTAIVTAGLGATSFEATIDRMVREIRDRLGWETLGVLLIDESGARDELRLVAFYGEDEVEPGIRFSVHRGVVGTVATTGRPYLVADSAEDPYFDEVIPGSRSEICAPLVLAGQVRGLVNAESPEPDRFTEEDLATLERLADQMSLMLHNAELLAAEKQTVSRLHELDQLKSRLLTIASHELRTPLTVVMGFAEVLSEHADSLAEDKRREYADAIARQAASLSQLVDQMLIATQIEQGQLQVQVTQVALETVVTEALGVGRAQHIEVGPGIGEAVVSADPFRLRQVLQNLFDNAIKYAADAGRIQIDARRTGGTVTVLVRDEGPGVPGYEHERVFQPFHQVGEHGVAGRRGIGLGLAVARDLVALMGGELKLFSAEGYGATFTLELAAG